MFVTKLSIENILKDKKIAYFIRYELNTFFIIVFFFGYKYIFTFHIYLACKVF